MALVIMYGGACLAELLVYTSSLVPKLGYVILVTYGIENANDDGSRTFEMRI